MIRLLNFLSSAAFLALLLTLGSPPRASAETLEELASGADLVVGANLTLRNWGVSSLASNVLDLSQIDVSVVSISGQPDVVRIMPIAATGDPVELAIRFTAEAGASQGVESVAVELTLSNSGSGSVLEHTIQVGQTQLLLDSADLSGSLGTPLLASAEVISQLLLDDEVSLTALDWTISVPEPSGIAPVATGVLLLLLLARSRRRMG